MSSALKDAVREALAQADQSFADTADVMEALSWVAYCAKSGEPIPPRIGGWLHQALTDYANDAAPTMDAALGLGGKRPPRRQRRDKVMLQGRLAQMCVLHSLGATIPQAAELVARLGGFTRLTLIDRYSRSGLGKSAAAARAEFRHRWRLIDVQKALAQYPDHGEEVRKAKSDILAMYARTSI